ncbi:MAG: hypothetical protein L0Y57_11150, partial [Beijerinckiaceae bacterium]|nr:hypothetical protein [Beijerinckiaceae bacterium]
MAAQSRHSVKERAVSEARQFFAVFLYVWLLLAVFGLYKWVILADENIVQHQGARQHQQVAGDEEPADAARPALLGMNSHGRAPAVLDVDATSHHG